MLDFPTVALSVLLGASTLYLIHLSLFYQRDPGLTRSIRAATVLYRQAWGKPWPRHTSIIHRSELGRLAQDDELYFDEGGDESAEYSCLESVGKVFGALSMKRSFRYMDAIVIREEYDLIRDMVESSGERAFIVTGQPGIGKTAFLIFLLLSRLEQKLPTAFQLHKDHYVIFDKYGVHLRHKHDVDPRLEDCWALSDSNDEIVGAPCIAFREMAQRVIQTTPPRPDRWKDWQKYCLATIIIMDLPKVLEIGAVLKEHNLDTASTLPYVSRLGPSLRTIAHIARDPSAVRLYGVTVASAINLLTLAPSSAYISSSAGKLPTDESSAVLYIRPKRSSTGVDPNMAEFIVPTKYLSAFVDGRLVL